MTTTQDLTVGEVSGIIAAAVVIGQFLHSSYWPSILGTDSSTLNRVLPSIKIFSYATIFSTGLVGLAAVLTPLGLYESVVAGKPQTLQKFHYIADNGIFGQGTPPRGNVSWSRICAGLDRDWACPNSKTNITLFDNATGSYFDVNGSYDTNVPQSTIELFQSGLSAFNLSVSSIFDIQWRSWTWALLDTTSGIVVNNGSSYPVGAFREIATVALDNRLEVIEGLVVDTVNGGVGFRNHSAPPISPYGSIWSEDILFIQPVTQCVDNNLTIDFSLPVNTSQGGSLSQIANLRLTDRGGFSKLNQTYPEWNRSDTQDKPEFWTRAYKAAWLNNVYTMAFLNVTDLRNLSDPNSRAFQYLNSTVNKEFPLQYSNGQIPSSSLSSLSPRSMQMTLFGDFIYGTDTGIPAFNNSDSIFNTTDFNITTAPIPPLYSNPLQITITNFSDIGILCAGAGGQDFANITNFAAACGLMYGVPRRADGVDDLMFLPGSEWTMPMYTCISAAQAVIKTVHFLFNGTDDLSGLQVLRIEDKTYPNEDAKPLWGVENTEIPLADANALWGLVSPDAAAKATNLSTLRKESLLLPGYPLLPGMGPTSYQNLPGVDFSDQAIATAYSIGNPDTGLPDYSGMSNLAMFRRWKDLSGSPESSAKILNLVWTDIATNAVVGTKSMAPSHGNSVTESDTTTTSSAATVLVTPYHRQVKYHLTYAIPGIVVLTFLLISAVLTSCAGLFGLTGPSKMRRYLNATSAGRIMTSNIVHFAAGKYNDMSTKEWIENGGTIKFAVGRGKAVLAETKTEAIGMLKEQ